jgi:hypothetical protein
VVFDTLCGSVVSTFLEREPKVEESSRDRLKADGEYLPQSSDWHRRLNATALSAIQSCNATHLTRTSLTTYSYLPGEPELSDVRSPKVLFLSSFILTLVF